MIILDDKLVGIWYSMLTDTQDWLCAIREIEPDSKYEITYRFRYYSDNKIFDSKDRKNWYQGITTQTRAYTIDFMRGLAQTVHAASKIETPMYELLNDSGFEEFERKFKDAPFVHMRTVEETDKDAEELNKVVEEELSRVTSQELGKPVGTKGHD
jgi:hypothetical protein